MDRIYARKIPLPPFAREPKIDIDEGGGEESFEALEPYLDKIYSHLHNELERSFNDPDIFFLHEEDGFPLRKDITGEYYLSDTTYGIGQYKEGETFRLGIQVHCLCNAIEARGEDRDYVSMEMVIYLNKMSKQIEYDPEFTSAPL